MSKRAKRNDCWSLAPLPLPLLMLLCTKRLARTSGSSSADAVVGMSVNNKGDYSQARWGRNGWVKCYLEMPGFACGPGSPGTMPSGSRSSDRGASDSDGPLFHSATSDDGSDGNGWRLLCGSNGFWLDAGVCECSTRPFSASSSPISIWALQPIWTIQ